MNSVMFGLLNPSGGHIVFLLAMFVMLAAAVVIGGIILLSVHLARKRNTTAQVSATPPPLQSAPAPQTCPRCAAPLPPGAPLGLCPRCVLAVGMATQTEATGEKLGPHGTKVLKPQPPLAEIAEHFPQLEILECLGRGGMGVVYEARQPKLNRLVALKILAPEKGADPKFAERFLREAQTLARLNHQNIVTIYDFGETDGLYFLLMEFVDGASLRQLLREGRMKPEEALAIVPRICEALQFAHEQGVVHRDIKPENVLLDKQGRVKIADFGIAKIVTGDQPRQSITQDQVIGTPHYMAPEQVEHPQAVDHRADIYSLGVVSYEMLTGELPLGKFQPPSKKVQIDVRLDEVVLRALEKEPERRYQQVSEVKTQVESIATTAPPTASTSQISASYHKAPWSPMLVLASSLCSVVCLGMALKFFINGTSASVMIGLFLVALTFGCALFSIRGYTITRDAILVHRLFWGTRLPLAGLKSARFEVGAMQWGIRFGNGGFFSFTGYHYNRALRWHRVFVSDPTRAVVLRYADRTVVLSPADPEAFVRDLAILTSQPKPVAADGHKGAQRAGEAPTSVAELSPWCRLLGILFGSDFTSPLAIKLANISALGFLGALAFLGFVPLPGMRGCFGFAGFCGFFGLIGAAALVEYAAQQKAKVEDRFREERNVETTKRAQLLRIRAWGFGFAATCMGIAGCFFAKQGHLLPSMLSILGVIGFIVAAHHHTRAAANIAPATAPDMSAWFQRSLIPDDAAARWAQWVCFGAALFVFVLGIWKLATFELRVPELFLGVVLVVILTLMFFIAGLVLRPEVKASKEGVLDPARQSKRWRKTIWTILVAVALGILFHAFVFGPYHAVTDSGSPDVPQGSYVMVYKLARSFSAGDIVVYRQTDKTLLGEVAQLGPANGVLEIARRDEPGQIRAVRSVPASDVLGRVILNTRGNAARGPNVVVIGTVTDAVTGKPIAGARVDDNRYGAGPRQAPQQAWTDANGRFELKTWHEEHTIAASASGYDTKLATLFTRPFGTEREVRMDFQLKPAPTNAVPDPARALTLFDEIEDFSHEFDAAFSATNLAAAQTGARRLLNLLTNFNAAVRGTDYEFPAALFDDVAKVRQALDEGAWDKARRAAAYNEEFARAFQRISDRMVELVRQQTPGYAVSFLPVVERVVSGDGDQNKRFIDFDTGNQFAAAEFFGPDAEPSPEETRQWWEKTGIDAMGDTSPAVRGLIGFGMVVASVANEEWDRLAPSRLGYYFTLAHPGTPVTISGKGELPATFAVKTREGGRGLLQITGFSDYPPGVKIRYKLEQKELSGTPGSKP